MSIRAAAIDFETTRAPHNLPFIPGARLVCASVVDEFGVKKSFIFNHSSFSGSYSAAIKEFILYISQYDVIVAHNMQFEWMWLYHIGVKNIWNIKIWCTMLAEYHLLHQNKLAGFSLSDLSKRYGITPKIDVVKKFWEAGYETDDIPLSILLPYCEQDTANALAIYQRQIKRVVDCGMFKILALKLEELKELSCMQYNGAEFDECACAGWIGEYDDEIASIDKQLKELTGESNINWGSDIQVGAYLFGGSFSRECEEWVIRTFKCHSTYRPRIGKCTIEYPGIARPPKGSKRGKSNVYPTREEILSNTTSRKLWVRKVLDLLIQRSHIVHTKNTFFSGFLESSIGGRLHASIHQIRTFSGRLSCTRPNLQNVPRGGTAPVKNLFVSEFS